MQISIIAYGTRGDVQPALALGRALRAHGHAVRLLASAHYKDWIESYGLAAVPATVDIQALMTSALGNEWAEVGTQPAKQMQIMKKLLDEHGLPMMRDAWQGLQGSELIVSSFSSQSFAPSIAQALGARQAVMLLQPPLLATRSGTATMNAPLRGRDSWINYVFGKLVLEHVVWWTFGKHINQFRRETMGLAEQTAGQNAAEWQRLPILLGYSPRVVAPAADWPRNVHTTGYWFLDEEGWTPPARLVDFLGAGEPPVCIGFGSMGGNQRGVWQKLLLEAIALSGRRAILLAGWAALSCDGDQPAAVMELEAAPHAWLFPRVAAVVHHGGAGTTAAAFRAGVPQVIVPHLADQPFWGERAAALGVGAPPIPRPKLTANNLSAAIQNAAGSAEMRQRAAALSAQIKSEDGLTAAVDLIEAA